MTETTTETHAEQQVRYTVERFEAQAKAVDVLESWHGLTADDVWEAEEADREELQEAREAFELPRLKVGEDPHEGLDDLDELIDQQSHGALDAYTEGRRPAGTGEWEATGCVVVTTTGGPHVQIEYDGNGALVVGWDWFGADRCERSLSSDAEAYVRRVFALDLLMDEG